MGKNDEPITLDTLAEKIDTVASTVDALAVKLETVASTVDTLAVRLDTVTTTVEKLATTVETLAAITKAGFDDVYSRMDGLEASLTEKIDAVDASLRVEIKATREEMRQGFAGVHHILGDHEERITRVERELAP